MSIKNVKLPPRNVGTNEVAYRDALQTHMDNIIQIYEALRDDFTITTSNGQLEITDNSNDIVKSFEIKFPDIGPLIPTDNSAGGTLGQIRINSGTNELEYYDGSAWQSTAGGGGSPSTNDVRYNSGVLEYYNGSTWVTIGKLVRYDTTSKNLEYDNSGTWTTVNDIRSATFGFDSGPVLVEETSDGFNIASAPTAGTGYLLLDVGNSGQDIYAYVGPRYISAGNTYPAIGIYEQTTPTSKNLIEMYQTTGSNRYGIQAYEDASANGVFLNVFDTGDSTLEMTGSGANENVTLTAGASPSINVGGSDLTVPDYVFEPSYDLMPINAYEKYINENKHLPLIGDGRKYFKKENHKPLVSRLWETVENQALYIVELNKRLEKLEKPNIFKRILKKLWP